MRQPGCVALLFLAACSPPPPEPTAIQRGAALFAPVSEALGLSMALDLKKSNPPGFAQYLKEIAGKDEGDLARKISKEILLQYADGLAISSSKEAEFKAGRYDDAMNAVFVRHLMVVCEGREGELTPVGRVVAAKLRTGEWKSGIDLEFGVRVLRSEAPKPKKTS